MSSINTNLVALSAQRSLKNSSMAAASSLSKLSSGLRVPTAKDDAAALAIGSNLRSEVAGLRQASLNAGQASSLLQIAEGAMGQINDVLVRMKSLAVQASSGQLSDADRTTLNAEFISLRDEIDRIAADTEFNGVKLLNTSGTSTQTNFNNSGATYTSYINPNAGFQSIAFGDAVGDGAYKIAYNATTDVMTMTNMVTGTSQSVAIGATAIAAGQTQTVNFNSMNAVVTLNSFFDKTANISATNTLTAGGFTGSPAVAGIQITSVAQDSTPAADGSTTFDFGSLSSARVLMAGAAATVTLTLAGAYENGTGATLTSSATVNLTTLGVKNVTLQDANGNNVNLSFEVTTVFGGTGATTTDYLTVNDLGQFVGTRGLTSTGATFNFKVGTGTSTTEDEVAFTVDAVTSTALAINGNTINGVSAANTAITAVNAAITTLSGSRADVGAAQSRLEFASNNIAVAIENSEAARSALLDVDVAAEITNFTTKQVLVQAGVSMLAQANQLPQNLLRLLQQ